MRGSIECSNQLDGPETAAAAAVKGVLPSPGTIMAVDGSFLSCMSARTAYAGMRSATEPHVVVAASKQAIRAIQRGCNKLHARAHAPDVDSKFLCSDRAQRKRAKTFQAIHCGKRL